MKRMIFATGNENKMVEIREILGDLPLEILSMKQAGIRADIEENGTSFEENALIKAREVCRLAGEMVLADDSGLEIDYLNGEPGIYSARYMGENTSYRVKNKNLMERLEGVPNEKRTARFVCAIAAVFPDGKELVVRGTVEGIIGYEERGENGFGYDPIFYLPERGLTTAELPPEEKNSISHRGNALRCPGQLHEACRLHRKPLQNICCVSNHLRYTAAACGLNDIRCLPNLLRLHGLLLHGKGCRAGHSISLQGRLHQFNFHFRGPPDIPALRPGGSFLLLLSQDCEMYSQHTQAVQEK